MSTKLFIGGLPWAMDNERLKQVFAEFGDVADARVILDRDTGRSRGFGFVTYSTEEGAENALQQLNGTEIDGRRIRVDRAQEKERPARPGGPRPDGGGPGGGRPGGGPGGGRPGGGRDFGGGGDARPPAGAPPPARERDGGGAPGGRPPRGAGAGAAPRRDDDWGGGERDRGERGRPKGKEGKGRGRRRGGRGGRGGGEDHDEVPPTSGVVDDFDDWD
jgi:hypothetical protein